MNIDLHSQILKPKKISKILNKYKIKIILKNR